MKTIIIGAGAAGLIAASELLKRGQQVEILEADTTAGGRIKTFRGPGFETAVEKGFEFIHGNLPVTIEILKKAGIDYRPVAGKMYRIENHELRKQTEFAEDWDELMEKMNEIHEDLSFRDFLQRNFSEEKYSALRETATRFAAGFDLADPDIASTLALRSEWMEEEDEQFRIPGGADQVVNHLLNECKKQGVDIHFSAQAEKILWKKNNVEVTTTTGKIFTAEKLMITVSLGMLQAEPSLLHFNPAIPNYIEAAKKIGFGSVVKVLLQFKEKFWQEKKNNLGFLFSGQKIPTWWTQLPGFQNLLTGWAGGPQAKQLEQLSDDLILEIAVRSLSNIFEVPEAELQKLLTTYVVVNWKQQAFTKGAYSFSTLDTIEARKLLNEPLENTIYFAGEAYYSGTSPGTLEAALVSGREAAAKITIQ